MTVSYLDSQSPFSIYGASAYADLKNPINGIFISALIGPESLKTAPQDAWGNLKIPMLESLVDYEHDSETWYSTDNTTGVVYSSLIGQHPLSFSMIARK